MNGKESCYDNAMVETAFMTLKAELILLNYFPFQISGQNWTPLES
jgi:hypothetical protein